jgi:hypothetical protein
MKKQYENNIRKGGIAEEIAILKQRREARKAKEEKKNIPQSSGQKKKEAGASSKSYSKSLKLYCTKT